MNRMKDIQRTRLTVILQLCVLLCFVVEVSVALQFPPKLTRTRLPFTSRKYRFTDEDEETREVIGNPAPIPGLLRKRFSIEKRKLKRETSLSKQDVPAPDLVHQPFYSNVSNVHELRHAVLDNGQELRELENISEEEQISPKELLNHQVLELIASRFHSRSIPGSRHKNDTHKLALSMEGGGMRGAVTAGMAAAIASLDLCDAFDAIYGSSAGSIVGAYMVSRQMCVDVYTSVLTAAQDKFVCKKRLIGGLALSAMDFLAAKQKGINVDPGFFKERVSPGMNISFVLDGILDEQRGLRPLDIEAFRANDLVQPLRVASSAVQNGKLCMKCFGTSDFFNQTDASGKTLASAACKKDGSRQGLFACLEPSMLVPGATGSPINLFLQGNKETSITCFDAFCFEPIPYRSAVEEGATHVLALRSRPEGFRAATKPGVYEKTVAPLFFDTNGQPEVAKFFEKGGQQYIYMEDLLTLEEGKHAGVTNGNTNGVYVPPAKVLFGVDEDSEMQAGRNRENWKRAHLLPISTPKGTLELSTLEQGRDEVLSAVRDGYAAAFDILAPAIGLEIDPELTGYRVAELMFPNATAEEIEPIMETQLSVKGVPIEIPTSPRRPRRKRKILRRLFRRADNNGEKAPPPSEGGGAPPVTDSLAPPPVAQQLETNKDRRCCRTDAAVLLSSLPGMHKVPNLAHGLREQAAALELK